VVAPLPAARKRRAMPSIEMNLSVTGSLPFPRKRGI
jgi:hypothetical protein